MSERREFSLAGQKRADKAFHYKACGLDNVYLLNGFERELTSDGPTTSFTNIDGLHRTIGLHLVLDTRTLGAREIRFLRTEMDLTQAELGAKIGISDQMVARWEKGELPIRGPAERVLRVVYIWSLLPEKAQADAMQAFISLVEHLNRPGNEGDNVRCIRTPTDLNHAKRAFQRAGKGWQPKTEAA